MFQGIVLSRTQRALLAGLQMHEVQAPTICMASVAKVTGGLCTSVVACIVTHFRMSQLTEGWCPIHLLLQPLKVLLHVRRISCCSF